MDSDDHPLLTKRMLGAVAFVALGTGLGVTVISSHLLLFGVIISLLGAAGVVWIFWNDLCGLRLRVVGQNGHMSHISRELWVVIALLAVAVSTPAVVGYYDLHGAAVNKNVGATAQNEYLTDLNLFQDQAGTPALILTGKFKTSFNLLRVYANVSSREIPFSSNFLGPGMRSIGEMTAGVAGETKQITLISRTGPRDMPGGPFWWGAAPNADKSNQLINGPALVNLLIFEDNNKPPQRYYFILIPTSWPFIIIKEPDLSFHIDWEKKY